MGRARLGESGYEIGHLLNERSLTVRFASRSLPLVRPVQGSPDMACLSRVAMAPVMRARARLRVRTFLSGRTEIPASADFFR